MRDNLIDYFERYAVNAINQMKHSIVAQGFYRRALLRLEAGMDLSEDLELIGKVGPEVTLSVVNEAIEDYKKQFSNAWAMPTGMDTIGKLKVTQELNPREHLPRFEVEIRFKLQQRLVKVLMTTIGENVKVEIDAGRNPTSAEVAIQELSKKLIFMGLQS
jgi:hypothetical protein